MQLVLQVDLYVSSTPINKNVWFQFKKNIHSHHYREESPCGGPAEVPEPHVGYP